MYQNEKKKINSKERSKKKKSVTGSLAAELQEILRVWSSTLYLVMTDVKTSIDPLTGKRINMKETKFVQLSFERKKHLALSLSNSSFAYQNMTKNILKTCRDYFCKFGNTDIKCSFMYYLAKKYFHTFFP